MNAGSRKVAALVSKYGAAAVAAKLGVNESAVRKHAAGERIPTTALRKKYAKVYAVTLTAWSKEVTEEDELEAGAPVVDASAVPPRTTREHLEALVRTSTAALEAAIADKNCSHRDRATLATSARANVIALARARGELDVTETMIVRSSSFARVLAAMREALRPHPDAARAVLEALERLESAKVEVAP